MSVLDEKIKKYEIPKWPYQPAFDRCLIYQIPTVEADTFKDSVLVKPEITKQREKQTSPRGVLVAAGQKARSILESHGIFIGHTVWFARFTLYKHEFDASNKSFATIRAAEINGSEELLADVESGREVFTMTEDGEWLFNDSDGVVARKDPEEFVDA